MPAHKVPRRRLGRHGVRLLVLANGAHVARWVDPVSRRQQQINLTNLGLGSAEAREQWAISKAKSIAEVRARVESGEAVAKHVTVATAVELYLGEAMGERTRKTRKAVLEAARDWLQREGCHDAADITPPMLHRLRLHVLRPESPHEASTKNRWLTTVGTWLRSACDAGYCPRIGHDAIRKATKRAKQPSKDIAFLRPDEQRRLLQAAIRHDADAAAGGWRPVGAFIMTLLLSGCRWAEIANLPWSEVDLVDGVLRLDCRRIKTKKSRIVTMTETPTLRALLAGLALRRGSQSLVFGDYSPTTWECQRVRLIERYGAPTFTANTLRRSAGTVLSCSSVYGAAGAFLSARRLGHSVTIAERHYAGALHGLPLDARTFEDCAGIRSECEQIVRLHGGVVEPSEETRKRGNPGDATAGEQNAVTIAV